MKYKLSLLVTGLLLANAASAATDIDLQHQPAAYLQRYLTAQHGVISGSSHTGITQTRTYLDFNKTVHTRIQQTYNGVPVLNATGVVHTPKASSSNSLTNNLTSSATMNGKIFEGLEKDLANTPAYALSDQQKAKALQLAKANFAKASGMPVSTFTKDTAKQVVFVDANHQAHYAWLVSFYADDGKTGAHRPTSIMDAVTLNVYHTYDQVMTAASPLESKAGQAALANMRALKNNNTKHGDEVYEITAGGIGGNVKNGGSVHDGAEGNQAALNMLAQNFDVEILPGQFQTFTICGLVNNEIIVTDVSFGDMMVADMCIRYPNEHNGTAWLSNDKNATRWLSDEMNEGYSPSIDAFAAAAAIKGFYQDWYNIPALVLEDGKTPMQLKMRVHYGRSYDNAFWDGEQMTFGDGGRMFYPLTSLGVAAHEISHGFTSQHSNLNYFSPQMGALHESFSDMASAAVEFYLTKSNTWELGREIMKGEGALRYLDNPTKDGRSIDNLKDFDNTEAHGGAGVTNKAFYLIATTNGWDTQKAFNIMVKANMNYWTSSMETLNEAACGVLAATRDYGYNIADVRVAFTKVGIDTDQCEVH